MSSKHGEGAFYIRKVDKIDGVTVITVYESTDNFPSQASYLTFGDKGQYMITDRVTMSQLCHAAGLSSGQFDYALPQEWVKARYWDKGRDTPIGVWYYGEDAGIFGRFMPLEEILGRIAQRLT